MCGRRWRHESLQEQLRSSVSDLFVLPLAGMPWQSCHGGMPATVACPCALGAAWALYLLLYAPPCCLYLAGQQQVLELEFI